MLLVEHFGCSIVVHRSLTVISEDLYAPLRGFLYSR